VLACIGVAWLAPWAGARGQDVNTLTSIVIPDPTARYQLVAVHSGKCLDVAGGPGAQNDGAAVWQWSCVGVENQTWRFVPLGNGYYFIVAAHSGKCLDITGQSRANGAPAQQWSCVDAESEMWHVTTSAAVAGAVTLEAKHSGLRLQLSGKPPTADGLRATQGDATEERNQAWRLVPVTGRGCYRVSLAGFLAGNETADNVLESDGVRDEVYVRNEVWYLDRDQLIARTAGRSRVYGDVGHSDATRVQAGGGGENGGIRGGDRVPNDQPWRLGGAPRADRLPMLLWQGALEDGRYRAVIMPTLWEWDDGTNGPLVRAWSTFVAGNMQVPRAAEWYSRQNPLEDPPVVPTPNGLALSNRDGDRPIGFSWAAGVPRDEGHLDFRPKQLVLGYRNAEEVLRSTYEGLPAGVIPIHYSEPRAFTLDGDYTLYLVLERTYPCPR